MSTQVIGLLLGDARQTVIGTREATNTRAISYDAYGWRRQAGMYPPSGFNGQHAEVQTGCYHLGNGHRIYNPVLQRFHSPDPLSPFKIGGLNPYAYCLGDPVNYQDPSGSAAQLPDWAIPVMTIAGNSAAFSAIFLAAVLGKPRPIGLLGTRLTMVGAPVAIIGASIQLAGKRQEGQVVGILGSAMTAIGSGLRFAQSLSNLAKKTRPWTEFKAGARHVFGLKPPKASADEYRKSNRRSSVVLGVQGSKQRALDSISEGLQISDPQHPMIHIPPGNSIVASSRANSLLGSQGSNIRH
jgi:RHS repeat-associated protein